MARIQEPLVEIDLPTLGEKLLHGNAFVVRNLIRVEALEPDLDDVIGPVADRLNSPRIGITLSSIAIPSDGRLQLRNGPQ